MDELERYLVGREHLIEMKNPVYKIKSALDKVRTQRNRILRADIDAELKREYLDELDRELNEQLKLIPRLKKYADQPIAEIGVFR
jgi:midasin (ATPase involved in ribosome maturation)